MLQDGEGIRLTKQFNNPRETFATGAAVNGVRYATTKATQRSIYGKKVHISHHILNYTNYGEMLILAGCNRSCLGQDKNCCPNRLL